MAKEPPVDLRALEVLVLLVAVAVAGAVGYGLGITTGGSAAGTPSNAGGTYMLNLVEIMDNAFNASSPAQPRYFIVTADGLASSANLTIPSHTRIVISIASYDTGSMPPSAPYGQVTGTLGNEMTVVNGTAASGDDTSVTWSETVSSVPLDQIVHTFTVPSLNLNLPVISGDTVVASFYANVTGTFSWFCMTPCGTGPDGLGGAMVTPGWMTGQITVT